MHEKCSHTEIEFLGKQKGGKGVNRYYICVECGSVLVLSEEKVLYEVPKGLERAEKHPEKH